MVYFFSQQTTDYGQQTLSIPLGLNNFLLNNRSNQRFQKKYQYLYISKSDTAPANSMLITFCADE